MEVAAGPGASTIKYSTDAELQSARNSSRARRHPDVGFLPRDVARESRKSDKPYRRLNARRPSGNKSGNLPPLRLILHVASALGSRSALSIFKRNRTWEKGWPRVNSGQSIAREFNYRNWPWEDEFARDIFVAKILKSIFKREIFIISLSLRALYIIYILLYPVLTL